MSLRMCVRFAVALSLMCAATARAQDVAPLTLDQAIGQALAANPGIAAAKAAADAAALRPELERHLMPPTATGQVFSWPFNTVNPGNAQMMFTLEQAFPGRGKRALRVTAAEREADVVGSRGRIEALRVASEVKAAYVELLLARRLLALLERSTVLADQVSAAAEIRYGTGRVSQQEVVRTMVERTRLDMARAEARERERLAAGMLNTLRALAPDAAIGAAAEIGDPAVPPADAIRAQVARHPEVDVPAREATAASAAAEVAASEGRADYVVSGGYMLMPNDTDAWTASVSFTWPNAPWSRHHAAVAVREAEGRRDAARAQQSALENTLAGSAAQAAVRVMAADERLVILEGTLVPRAEHALELARLAYQSDRGELGDVVDAMRLSVDLATEAAELRTTRRLAVAELERAMGADIAPDGALVQR